MFSSSSNRIQRRQARNVYREKDPQNRLAPVGARFIPLLKELGLTGRLWCYKHFAPSGAKARAHGR